MRLPVSMTTIRILLSIALFLAVVFLYTSCDRSVENANADRSITFILSSDATGKQYFSLASEYFSTHESGKTVIVTSECRSIACVIDYLNLHADHKPWQKINLVAHGNSKTGLNLYLSDGGHKATPKRMVQEVVLSTLPRLQAGVVDSSTRISVLACGIGTNPMIALSMKSFFKPVSGPSPEVECTDKYIIFRPDTNGKVQLLKASYWPYYYRRGYRPSISEIDQQMNERYPKDPHIWSQMLGTPSDSSLTQDYHIPISYTKYYTHKDDRPSLQTDQEKIQWAKSQPQIMEKLAELNMGLDDFTWQIDKRIITAANGSKRFAVKAVGMTTVLCFLEVED